MTNSEKICNELGAKFFCKDYVYENLKYFNSINQKVELCDGLFEYLGIYVILQIKERFSLGDENKEKIWLQDTVYTNAVNQMMESVEAIKNRDLVVNDLYHQKVKLNKDNLLFPVIVFDNPQIKNYNRVVELNGMMINVFNLCDFNEMMNVLVHPYDIIYYLQERCNLFNKTQTVPKFIFWDSAYSSIISRIENEKEFAQSFELSIYDGKLNKKEDALRVMSIIDNFRKNQNKKAPNYKVILNVLQMIQPQMASVFMERFQNAWDNACKNFFDYTRAVQIQINSKKTSIVFFSVGYDRIKDMEYYQILCDAKQQQHKSDSILLIVFYGDSQNTCQIDWVYYDKKLIEEPDVLKYYEELGFYNGIMDKELFEIVCSRLLQK